jgi:hypothetical protein
VIYAALLYIVLTDGGRTAAGVLGDQIRELADAKTLPYDPIAIVIGSSRARL